MPDQRDRAILSYASSCPYCGGKPYVHIHGRQKHIGLSHTQDCSWPAVAMEMHNAAWVLGKYTHEGE